MKKDILHYFAQKTESTFIKNDNQENMKKDILHYFAENDWIEFLNER